MVHSALIQSLTRIVRSRIDGSPAYRPCHSSWLSVNPWTNNGTSTYYYHPHSLELARLLQRELLDELGIANNTIVQYSTDNGPHYNTWPDAGPTLFRSEKNSNWEGAYRVPAYVRWPGRFPWRQVPR